MELLGFLVDTVTLQLIFPTEKLRKIQQLAQRLLYQQSVSVRDMARFVGKASASMRAIWQAPLHYRALQFLINSVTPESLGQTEQATMKFNANLNLTKEAESSLRWWDQKVPIQPPIVPQISSMTIESDVSNKGWGARQDKLSTGGRWSQEESSHHINYLELLAAFLALQSFAKQQQYDNSDENGQ